MSEISKHREPVTHYLKIYPEFFSAVCTGVKRAELRKYDRDFRVGDKLHLMETPRGCCSPTGEYINATITHIADVSEWIPGYVLLSIERERAEPVRHHISELEKVLAWIEKLPVPTQGATTNYSRLKSVVDTCREAAPVVDDELKQAINRLLDSDGSRGVYSAVRSYEARQELERMLAAAPDKTLKICDRAGS